VVHGLPGMGWTLVNKCHTFFTSWLCPANRFEIANIHHTIHSALSSGFLRLSDLNSAQAYNTNMTHIASWTGVPFRSFSKICQHAVH
jgi:hypothetical protein